METNNASLAAEKAEFLRLMQLPGQVRGVVFKTDLDYIRGLRGEGDAKKFSRAISQTGLFPRDDEVKALDFYPIGLRAVSLLVMQRLFDFSPDDIKTVGLAAPKLSLVIKLFTKYFLSISATANQAPSMWEKHYRGGKLLIKEVNEKEKRIILELEGLDLHPVFCKYLEGYFSTVVKLVVGQPTSTRETKCPFQGGLTHQFVVTW